MRKRSARFVHARHIQQGSAILNLQLNWNSLALILRWYNLTLDYANPPEHRRMEKRRLYTARKASRANRLRIICGTKSLLNNTRARAAIFAGKIERWLRRPIVLYSLTALNDANFNFMYRPTHVYTLVRHVCYFHERLVWSRDISLI